MSTRSVRTNVGYIESLLLFYIHKNDHRLIPRMREATYWMSLSTQLKTTSHRAVFAVTVLSIASCLDLLHCTLPYRSSRRFSKCSSIHSLAWPLFIVIQSFCPLWDSEISSFLWIVKSKPNVRANYHQGVAFVPSSPRLSKTSFVQQKITIPLPT